MATILVIEDDTANRALATLMLQSAGYDVLSAADAETGIAMAHEHHPALILMDIQLPGMDGLEATRLLKHSESLRAIPVIAVTGLAMAGDEERIRTAGCDDYIAKPLVLAEFLSMIAERLANDVYVNHNGVRMVGQRQSMRVVGAQELPLRSELCVTSNPRALRTA